nr:PREDICTED: actin-depolymerizing factor 5-like isoform X1 [Musa acuminata subsp. malaccensis]
MAMAFKMATEGMRVKQECLSSFMEMKWKRVSRYVVYKIDEKTREVMVDKVGRPGEGYDGLAASLPNDDCRYAVFDFDFVSVDNCPKRKMFFITWSPLLLFSLSLSLSLSLILEHYLLRIFGSDLSLYSHIERGHLTEKILRERSSSILIFSSPASPMESLHRV